MALRIVLGIASTASCLAVGRDALAEELTIGRPGVHPDYSVELEPEAIVLFGRDLADGPGLGLRASIPFMQNGFISAINDTPGISFGISRSPIGAAHTPFYAPAVFQWSFWLSPHWSVMGEAGAALAFGDGTSTQLQAALMAGGRFHVTPNIAVTARISLPNTPSVGVGVSFFF